MIGLHVSIGTHREPRLIISDLKDSGSHSTSPAFLLPMFHRFEGKTTVYLHHDTFRAAPSLRDGSLRNDWPDHASVPWRSSDSDMLFEIRSLPSTSSRSEFSLFFTLSMVQKRLALLSKEELSGFQPFLHPECMEHTRIMKVGGLGNFPAMHDIRGMRLLMHDPWVSACEYEIMEFFPPDCRNRAGCSRAYQDTYFVTAGEDPRLLRGIDTMTASSLSATKTRLPYRISQGFTPWRKVSIILWEDGVVFVAKVGASIFVVWFPPDIAVGGE